ncbi:sugar phosphate isomerase/epimerase family protein [Paenibacillus beijingensis]|uniref:Xylose isomerase-like TIM barrel domain-containing protein n=1 Tax=Paenibacillus beijingensis TaxID=1126833 RepID=A0A0D5NG14_9BACL|nr:sugar phosphate isomerase/epimerase [Paenibacillus beijingensis]AJY74085.1 hypothetical protein VN24_05055 [Paenibacillus beijingensis]
MSIDIGLQLYSVRDELQKDYYGTLQKVAAIGFKQLEIAIHNVEAGLEQGGNIKSAELKKMLDELGLSVAASHVGPIDKADLDEVIAYNLEIGSGAIVCPLMTFKDKGEVLAFSEAMNGYGDKCKSSGLDFYFHNHYNEFQQFEGQSVMDLLLEHTDPSAVKFEFDTYWALRAGIDPIEYLTKLGSRCDKIHQKDLPASVQPVNLFELVGHDEHLTVERIFSVVKPEDFAEIGEGVMDIAGIIDAARKMGHVKTIFVEQDQCLGNQLESVERSFRNLTAIMNR